MTIDLSKKNARCTYVDLLKGLGIILVVCGHFVEPFRNVSPFFNALFVVIYSFHMPLFCFLTGCFAKPHLKKIMHIGIVYILAQMFFLIFRIIFMNISVDIKQIIEDLKFPFWHLWYLYAMIFWLLSLYIIKFVNKKILKVVYCIIIVIIALISGYIEIPYSLTRVIAFYPFFLTGFFVKEHVIEMESNKEGVKSNIKRNVALVALAIVGIIVMLCSNQVNTNCFFSYQSYFQGDYTIIDRIVFYILSSSIIYLLIKVFASVRWVVLERLGMKTMPVFVLHALLFWSLSLSGINEVLCNRMNLIVIGGYILLNIIVSCILFTRKPFLKIEELISKYII